MKLDSNKKGHKNKRNKKYSIHKSSGTTRKLKRVVNGETPFKQRTMYVGGAVGIPDIPEKFKDYVDGELLGIEGELHALREAFDERIDEANDVITVNQEAFVGRMAVIEDFVYKMNQEVSHVLEQVTRIGTLADMLSNQQELIENNVNEQASLSDKVYVLNGIVEELNGKVVDLKSNKKETLTDIEDSINKLRTQTNTLISTTNVVVNEDYTERLSRLNEMWKKGVTEYAANKQEILQNMLRLRLRRVG